MICCNSITARIERDHAVVRHVSVRVKLSELIRLLDKTSMACATLTKAPNALVPATFHIGCGVVT